MTSAECEDEVDIYGDLPNVPCIEDNIIELEETKKVLEDEVKRLKEKLEEVTIERNELKFKNKNLGLNISTLYKTATAEIERKDKLIAQLRREKDNIIFRRQNKSLGKDTKHTSDDSGDHQCSPDVTEQNHYPGPEAKQTVFHHPGPEMEQTELHHPAPETEQTELHHSAPGMEQTEFLHTGPEMEQTEYHHPAPGTEQTELHHPAPGMEQTELHEPAPDTKQTEFHHPGPEIEQTEFHHPENCASNKLTSSMYVPPEKVLTVFSRRHLHLIPENKKLISLDKSNEDIKQKSVIPWNLIPITDTERHKDTNVKVHNNSAYLNKEYVSPSQNESKRKRSNSENCRYLSSARSFIHAETESERMHTKRKEFSVHSSKSTSHTMSRGPVSRYFHQGYEHKPYWKYKAERQSENYRSRTYPRYTVSGHHSNSKRWESYKIPRITRETSLSRAYRSQRSWPRSRSVSQSRIVTGSIQDSANRRYCSRTSSGSMRSALTEISDKSTDLSLKLPDSATSTLRMKTQLSTDTRLEDSKNIDFKPQKKVTHDTEPHSVMGAAGVEFEHSLQTAQTTPVINTPASPSAGSKRASGSTTLLNLSEHSSFKRSRRAKIVELNTEMKPSDARTTDLVKNTNNKLFSQQNQSGGMKRVLETKEADEVHLPDSKRQALNDITGRECYNYTENDNFTDHKQLYSGTVMEQPSSCSVNENILKDSKVNGDRTDSIKNVDTAMLKGKKKPKEQIEETGLQNIKLNVKQLTVDNAGIKKEASSIKRIKSDSTELNATNINVANRRMTDRHHGEHIKIRFDRKPSDTRRKASGSCRPQYNSQRYCERSCKPITSNSHCKRRSPSELLNKDKAGRILSNTDEMVRNERSRSRSSEGTSTYRESEKYKVIGSVDGKSVKYLANRVSSEEQRMKNKYSKGDTKKLASSQDYKEKKEKHRVEVDGTKQNVTGRQKEDCGINVHKTFLVELMSDNSIINSKIHDDCGGQTKLVRIMESSRSATLNEKDRCGNKELQQGPSTLISVDPSNLNEIIKTNISENNHNSFPTSKSVEIRRSRSNNHERGSQVVISTGNSISLDGADLEHGTRGIHKAGCDDIIRKSKELKYKNKKLCTSNTQNYDNVNDENGKNSTEAKKTTVSNTIERTASGQDEEHDRNFQKENLLESNAKDVKKDDPKCQTAPGGTDDTENEKKRGTEFRNIKAKRNINKSVTEEEIKKTENKSDKKESNNSQDYRSNKQVDERHEIAVCVSEESKVNRKQASCNENVQQVNLLHKNEDNRVITSIIQDECQSTEEKPEVSVSNIRNEKQKSDFKESLYVSPKEITAHLPVCSEANTVEKTKKTGANSRSKHRKVDERVLEKFKLYEISDAKHAGYKTKKAVSKAIQNKKQCERTEKMPNSLQRHKDRGQNEDCISKIAQMDLDNAEKMKKQKKDCTDAEKISCMETNKEDGIFVSRIQSGCKGQTESPADRLGNSKAAIINEEEKFNYKDSKHVLSKQSVLGSSVPDEVNKSENEKDTMLRLTISKKEGLIPRVSEKYNILDNVAQKDSKHKSSKEVNNENEETIPNICQNYKMNKEENQQPTFSISQTDVNNAKENQTRRKYEKWSENVQKMSVCDKNIGDEVTKMKAHNDYTGDFIKSPVDRMNNTTASSVHRNKKSDSKEFNHVSSGHVAELPSACNENKKGSIRRSRSRSCEDGSELLRGLEKHKVAVGTDEKCVTHNTDNTESEETKKNKYSKDEDKISSLFQNHEKMMGKKEDFEVKFKQREAQYIKQTDTTRKENKKNKNVQIVGVPGNNKGQVTVEPEIKNCTEAQWESVKSMNDVTQSEKEDTDYKEMQNGKCKEPMPEMPVFHEVSEENTVISNHTPTDNSVTLSAASSKVSPVINLKFRARSMSVKLEDSKAVLSVNITPPHKEVRVVTVQDVGISTAGINSVTETQKSAEDRDFRQNVIVSCNNGGNTNCKTVEEVPKGNGTNIFCSVKVGDSGTVDYKLQNIQTKQLHETQNIHEFNIKTFKFKK